MYQSMESQLHKLDSEHEIYRMESIIGSGKFGTVYKGYDKQNGRFVALKYVHNNNSETWKKEIKALEKFNHPNIIKYYGYIQQKCKNTDQTLGVYLVTQFVRGRTLQEYISSANKVGEKGLSQIKVLKIFKQLLEGYEHMHNLQFMHRDIKPENILIDENQNVKIIDLGQSKQRILAKTKGIGTPLYSAPETFTGQNLKDLRRDVWSLGLVLYEMITGKCYFQDWKYSEDEEKFRKFLQTHSIKIKFPSSFHPFWTQIAKKMLEKNYNIRKNLHQILYNFENDLPVQLQRKLAEANNLQFVTNNLGMSAGSGNTNPLVQSQNQFQFSRTKKYLKFFKNKHNLLVFLTMMLTKYKYPFLSNAHKLILVFLSLNIYIASIDHLLKRFDKNKITITENQMFDVSEFQEPYQSAMINYLSKEKQYYEKQSKTTKITIFQRIIPKFQAQHKLSNSETDSLDSASSKRVSACELIEQHKKVKEIIPDFMEGINYSKARYLQIFKEVVFSQDYHQQEQNIRRFFYQEDMVVYYLLLIICRLDSMLCWGHDYLGDEITKLKQELENTKRNDAQVQVLIQKINKLNVKN